MEFLLEMNGGDERVRTDDLLRAKQALSQLSYTPTGTTMKIYTIFHKKPCVTGFPCV